MEGSEGEALLSDFSHSKEIRLSEALIDDKKDNNYYGGQDEVDVQAVGIVLLRLFVGRSPGIYRYKILHSVFLNYQSNLIM
jgi:hypothetical protein